MVGNSEDFYWVVGQRLRDERSKVGLTQEDLAEATNSSQATISKIESGKQHTFLYTLYMAGEVLGCGIEAFIYGADREATPFEEHPSPRTVTGMGHVLNASRSGGAAH